MKERDFATVGFLAASVIPAALFTADGLLTGMYSGVDALILFEIVFLYSIPLIAFLGLPAFFLLRPLRPGRWWSVLVTGFLLGVLSSIILRLPNEPDPHDFILFGPVGAATVFVFWLIWRRSLIKADSN